MTLRNDINLSCTKKPINVLFIASKGINNTLVMNQAKSLKHFSVSVDFFAIKSGLLNYLLAVFKLRKYLKKHHYDILHAHYGWSGVVTVLAKKREKMVISFMGDDILGTLNQCYRYTLTSRITSLVNILLAKYKFDFNIVKAENLFRKMDSVNNVEIIPNGVDLKSFYSINRTAARETLNWELEDRFIIFVSNPDRAEKNYQLAVRAVEILNIASVHLLHILGIKNEDLTLYYSAADLLVLTSIHEGSPNVIKEAMACNCPIVSTDVGDVRWVIGRTEGCFIASFDPDDFAEKIALALKFSENGKRTNGRDRIKRLGLDSVSIAKKIIKIYETVLLEK